MATSTPLTQQAAFRAGITRPGMLNAVLVKPSGPDCNLDCEYCFYLRKEALFPQTKVHRMSSNVLEALIRKGMAVGAPQMTFIWQGGEPTLMGLPFYEEVIRLQKRHGKPRQQVANSLQTNGLLLDESWLPLLRDFNFLVGLSIDGPREVHDRYRPDKGGQDSFDKVVRAARLLLDNGIPTNALCVVTGPLSHTGKERYQALSELGFEYLQFIPCVEHDPQDPSRPAPYSVSGEQYGRFLIDVFECWRDDWVKGRPRVNVRNFDALLHSYVNERPPDCTLLAKCGVYLTVEHNGDVYPCDFFVENPWRLGNVLHDDLQTLYLSDKMEAFGAQKQELPTQCVECKYKPHCHGGCPKDRWSDHAPQHLCHATQVFLDHAHGHFKELAARLRRRWRRQR